MRIKINVGTDVAPEWIDVGAENAKRLNGLTVEEILLMSNTQLLDLLDVEISVAKTEVRSAIETYRDMSAEEIQSLTAALNKKVDKVTGKGLSTNDYTNIDKQIVDSIAGFRKFFEDFKENLEKNITSNLYATDFTSVDDWTIHSGYYNQPLHRIEAMKGE